jgi:hypothetical protein
MRKENAMTTSTTSESNSSERITFIPYLQPPLTSGEYEIRVDQAVSFAPQPFTAKRSFYVASERFGLTPSTVSAMFPPQGSLGDHSNVLPHIILGRGSLPWERSPDGSRPGEAPTPLSWLLLLLFDET